MDSFSLASKKATGIFERLINLFRARDREEGAVVLKVEDKVSYKFTVELQGIDGNEYCYFITCNEDDDGQLTWGPGFTVYALWVDGNIDRIEIFSCFVMEFDGVHIIDEDDDVLFWHDNVRSYVGQDLPGLSKRFNWFMDHIEPYIALIERKVAAGIGED